MWIIKSREKNACTFLEMNKKYELFKNFQNIPNKPPIVVPIAIIINTIITIGLSEADEIQQQIFSRRAPNSKLQVFDVVKMTGFFL